MKSVSMAVIVATAAALGACATQRTPVSEASAPDDAMRSDAAWIALDTNRDGYLTMDELLAQRATALRQDFRTADLNRDGRISWAEWDHWWPRITRTPAAASMAALNATDTLQPMPAAAREP